MGKSGPKPACLWPGGGTKMGDGGKKGTGRRQRGLVGAGGFRWCGDGRRERRIYRAWGQFELGGGLINLDFAFGRARLQLFLP